MGYFFLKIYLLWNITSAQHAKITMRKSLANALPTAPADDSGAQESSYLR